MYRCIVTYQAGKSGKHTFNHQTKEDPKTISDATWCNHIILEMNYKKPITILQVQWHKCSPAVVIRKHLLNTKLEASNVAYVNRIILNLTNNRLNARDIAKELKYITKAELISVIMGYQTLE
jgi:hypothetical protein